MRASGIEAAPACALPLREPMPAPEKKRGFTCGVRTRPDVMHKAIVRYADGPIAGFAMRSPGSASDAGRSSRLPRMARHRDSVEARAEGSCGREADSAFGSATLERGGAGTAGLARPRLPVWWSLILEGEESLRLGPDAEPYDVLLRMIS